MNIRNRFRHRFGFYPIGMALAACLMAGHTGVAQARQTISLPGLVAPVEIRRDQWGVNHIYATHQADLFFAQGYMAATDRMYQLEMWRRQATGTLAEILGAPAIAQDIGARLFRYRGDLTRELQHYHPQGKEIIQAFTNGINARVAEIRKNPSLLPAPLSVLGIMPGFWTPADVVSRHAGLAGNATDELRTARAVARAGVAQVKKLSAFHPGDPHLELDGSLTLAMLEKDILGLYTAGRRAPVFGTPAAQAYVPAHTEDRYLTDGSNNWVVSGARTKSGMPLLANDPHRAITAPSLRYMVHLHGPGWNVTGAGEPAIPGVSIGHNAYGAWGLTIFETDQEDLYVYDLNPDNLSQYKYKGKWLTMDSITEVLTVKNSKSVQAVLRYTVHGPVTFIDTVHKKAWALQCGWLAAGGAPYLASLRMNQAKDWKTFREACAYSHLPGENMIWADRKGNIGWQVVGLNPLRRAGHSGMVPVPGDGRFDWQGFQPMLQRPGAFNPPAGFLATANEHVTPAAYPFPETLAYTWADPYRGNRIRDVLQQNNRVSAEASAALQTDYYSIPASKLIPLLLQLVNPDSLPGSLHQWDFRLNPSSVNAAIYAVWERKIMAAVTAYAVPDTLKGLVTPRLSRITEWLERPGTVIPSPKVRDSLVRASFALAMRELEQKFGKDTSQWHYGQERLKHAKLQHPMHNWLPPKLQEAYTLGPLPRGGNANTPNATGNTDRQTAGASFRMITDLADWDATLMMNTPGQSENPESPFFGNLFPLWASDGYFPAPFSKAAVAQNTVHILLLQPALKP